MDFSVFDQTEIEQYTAQAKALWGETDAYKEYEQKNQYQIGTESKRTADRLMLIFVEWGKIKHLAPDSNAAQAMVEKLRQFITSYYYNCTPQILRGLGQMYICDERMKQNINHAGGAGTAEFANQAIFIYCDHLASQNQ